MVFFPIIRLEVFWSKPHLSFEETAEIGAIFKAYATANLTHRLIGMNQQPLGFDDKPITNESRGRKPNDLFNLLRKIIGRHPKFVSKFPNTVNVCVVLINQSLKI